MKNLKRLMSVVLSVVMLLSFVVSTSAATFTDVAESDKAFEAVEILAALGILEGKEAGVFDPSANIKRSEFAAVICRAMNQSPVGIASFTDVAADHWAYNYIAWAASQKIVNGRGDGTFDPDANVTYNEAIAMIVRAMGYEFYVEEYLGGYPTGYSRIAGSYKIDADVNTSNGNAAATRADVASLIYNAFDAPLMDYSYAIGADMEYVIYNGSNSVNNEKRTLLSYYSDIYKVKASIDKTFKMDASMVDAKGNKYMNITIDNFYGFTKADVNRALDEKINASNQLNKVLANNDAWAAYAGLIVDAYVTLNEEGKVEIVAMVPVVAAETLELTKDVIEDVAADKIVYEDENGREQDAAIKTDATLYINNMEVGKINDTTPSAAYTAYITNGLANFATVKLVNSDNGDAFDKIYVTYYNYGIIEEVDTDYATITTRNNDMLSLGEDETPKGFSYAIYKDGAEIALEDLAAGDMINVVIGDDDNYDAIEIESDTTFVEIYVTNNTIESSVSSVSPDGTKVTIDGEVYEPVAGCPAVDPGTTGIFYITIDGYLYDIDVTSTYSDNYGFVLELGQTKGAFGDTWQVKILDKNNAVKTLNVKSSIFVTDIEDEDATAAVNNVYKRRQKKDAALDTVMAALKAEVYGASQAAVKNGLDRRLVTFKEANGELTELVFANSLATATEREFNVANGASYSDPIEYSAKVNRLGGKEILDSSVLFVTLLGASDANITLNNNGTAGDSSDDYYELDSDKVQVYSKSSLKDGQGYTGILYGVDANRAFGAALITSGITFAGDANALAVVTSVATGLNAAGDQADVITLIQAGETKTLALDAENYDGPADLEAGDVIQYTVNGADEINNAEKVFDFGTNALVKAGDITDIAYRVGVVKASNGKVLDLAWNETTATTPAVVVRDFALDMNEASTNALVDVKKLDGGKSSAIVAKTGTSYIRAYKEASDAFTTDVYVVVVRLDERAIVDVVAYAYDKDYDRTSPAIDAKTAVSTFTAAITADAEPNA